MDPQDLYAAFTEQLDKLKALKAPDWVAKLPALKSKPGMPKVSSEVIGQLLRREVEKGKDLGGVAAVRAVVDEAALDKLGVALVKSWYTRGGPSKEKWQLLGAGHLGGALTADAILQRLYKDIDKSDGHHRSLAAIETLRILSTLNDGEARACAVSALAMVHTIPTKYASRRQQADEALESLGDDRTLLVSQNVPRAPEPKSEPIVRALLERRFERWMIDGARINGFDFEENLAEHPFASGLTHHLVWAVFGGGEPVPFRLEDGAPVGSQGERIDLDPDASIGVAHPLELSAQQLPVWQEVAKTRELAPPFAQMTRKVFTLRGDEPSALELTRYTGLGYNRLLDPLVEAGFIEGEKGDMGGTETFVAVYARGSQKVSVYLGYGPLERTIAGDVDYNGQPRKNAKPWGKVDPVVVSEVLYALDRAGGREKSRGTKAAGIAPKGGARPVTGGAFPYAEFAKSGRSTCVVCAEKIEKGAVRVAVEREIDTGSFTKTGAVFLHATCTSGAPELQRDDLDAVLTANSPGVWPPA